MEGKASWGDGEWQSEPDHKEWRDETTGLPCIAHRNMCLGNWCGYVAVPPGHPLHGMDYDSVDVVVHGGLTYANECSGAVCHVAAPGEPDDVWWFGFDCGHSGDISPGMEAFRKEQGLERFRDYVDSYKTLNYVERNCAGLAKQLNALTTQKETTT